VRKTGRAWRVYLVGSTRIRMKKQGKSRKTPGMRCLLACVVVAAGEARATTDPWDMPPLRYSDTAATDPLALLAAGAPHGKVPSDARTPLDRLRFVLKLLDVPEESQVLVFSKTSKQITLIHPGNPRCLFFNENSYVGYVPGGDIEVITHDPVLGAVFYLIGAGNEPCASAVIPRSVCHAMARPARNPCPACWSARCFRMRQASPCFRKAVS